MFKHTFHLTSEAVRMQALAMARSLPVDGSKMMVLCDKTRSNEQNALMWPLLEDISRQVEWYGHRLSKEEWKDVLTASLKKQKVVPAIDGGFVVAGSRTSTMGKKEFSELLDLIFAFGAQHNVRFSSDREEFC